jgi:imidazolonepropionase-like amidohydrolase
MKKLTNILLFASLSFTAAATDIVPGNKQTNPILIKGGTLHTVTDGIKENHDMLIEKGLISKIGQNLIAPQNSQVIDASGKQVYPGLIGLSTNLGLVEIGAVRSTRDNNEVGRATPEVQAHVAYNADSEIIPTVRSNGITHVQITPAGSGLNGQSSLMQLDAWSWENALVKANTGMHLRWPSVGINKAWWEERPAEKQKEANQKASKQFKKTFEQIKAYAKSRKAKVSKGSKAQALDLRWEAMLPVLARDVPVFVHADDYRQIEQAIYFADAEKLKIIIVGGRDADKAAKLLKERKIPVVFNAAWGRTWRSDEAMDRAFSTPAMLESLGIEYSIAIESNWPVRNLAFAAGQSIAYGASSDAALRSVTLHPARVLGMQDSMGSLTEGKQANIVISSGDLFDHLTHNVETMLIEGRMIDLDNRHKRLYKKYSAKPKL